MVGTIKKNEKKIKYYSLTNILKREAQYNLIIGERSNGKTYACLKYALENYIKYGKQTAIVRRWQVDLKGRRASTLFDALISDGTVSKLTDGEYNLIHYWSGKWYFANRDEDNGKTIYDSAKPFAYAFTLSDNEHDKSTSYPMINTVVFDEFLTRQSYLADEFVTFMNVLSTIIRQRDDVKIFMLGNTVNKHAPYFKEMGLFRIKDMKQGTIDVYKYGDSGLKVAVEYCASMGKVKSSAPYFAFNNPRLQMINTGAWELDIYPHLPREYKYTHQDIVFQYFIEFEDNILHCEIVQKNNAVFTFIHTKTTPLKEGVEDIIFTLKNDPRPNYYVSLLRPVDEISKQIIVFFKKEKVFYQDNEVGEIVRNYIDSLLTN